ncbi:acyl-CoA dehydrogenase family protein [Pseudomonas jinjuensis]|uniref:Acyl-CoA dehydrogenase n=1 Tax=Pseudomonas jinjuensis TaxID=198616 RepID=A0A1H0R2L6_9PSED|nr:acyl-CoA dehydrogenase family protein [Pseudomonas jinjuensis]SDP23761.1 hypothetical protein SAMN05216193_12621 [Pseudomonas jinjuensis]
MDFSLTEDQKAIAEMAGGVFRDYCTDERLREFDLSGKPFMAELWGTCIQTGLLALAIPEAVGGSGLGMTELMGVLQAQGAGLGQVPLWQHQLGTAALARWGDESLHGLLEELAAGTRLLSLSFNGSADSPGIGLRLSRSERGLQLDGTINAVPLAGHTCRLLLLAEGEEGAQLVLIEPRDAGVALTPGVYTHGLAVADVQCDGVIVEAAHVLPVAATAWLEQRAIAALAALQVGVSEEQIRRTVEYVNERRQFDRAIGTFQAVQMTMADCRIAVEALRTALYQLCYRLDNDLGCDSEALATRWLTCETGHLVGHKTQHVHGGIGVDLTYPIHRFLYWSRDLSHGLGGSAASLERLGDWLANNDKLGWKYDLEENQSIR